jgi:hypothetical protein
MTAVVIIVETGAESILGVWPSILSVLGAHAAGIDVRFVVGAFHEVTLAIYTGEQPTEVSL